MVKWCFSFLFIYPFGSYKVSPNLPTAPPMRHAGWPLAGCYLRPAPGLPAARGSLHPETQFSVTPSILLGPHTSIPPLEAFPCLRQVRSGPLAALRLTSCPSTSEQGHRRLKGCVCGDTQRHLFSFLDLMLPDAGRRFSVLTSALLLVPDTVLSTTWELKKHQWQVCGVLSADPVFPSGHGGSTERARGSPSTPLPGRVCNEAISHR